MKLCDITQFYAPRSGGVKRYLHEKIAFIRAHRPGHEHLLIVPGSRTELIERGRTRVYSIASPRVSRRTGYRILLNLRAVDEIIERERPHLIECADPYQLGWSAAAISHRYRMPAIAFYHSHFPEAYLRRPAEALGRRMADGVAKVAATYVRALYNRFALTLVPSPAIAETLRDWGVAHVRVVALGVNTDFFTPEPADARMTRLAQHIPERRTVLLYVGRLAPEKNVETLLRAFELLHARQPGRFHLLVVGDGQQRARVDALQQTGALTWLRYAAQPAELAQLYRAADMLVHPGLQETFGLTALEAQACGTPVLGIRGSSIEPLVTHEHVEWAETNTPEALADAIASLSGRDCKMLGRLAAPIVAERYAWPHVFERLFCIYREVCANYSVSPAR